MKLNFKGKVGDDPEHHSSYLVQETIGNLKEIHPKKLIVVNQRT